MTKLRVSTLSNFRLLQRTLLSASITLAATLAPATSAAYDIDENSAVFALLNAADDNSWVRLDLNDFDSVWAPQDQTLQQGSLALQYKIIDAWSSFAWDSNRGKLIFWGGGHANYTGNDVYTFNVNTLLWERGSLPSAIFKPAPNEHGISFTAVDGADSAPISSHTYDSQFYFRNADKFVTMGGAAYNDGAPFRRFTENEDGSVTASVTGPYFWDPAKADPNKVGGSTGSHVRPEAYPDVVGGEMWENRDLELPFRGVNTTSALDPSPDIDRAMVQNSGGLYEYIVPDVNDSSQDSLTRIGVFSYSKPISRQGVAGFDPVRNIYLRTLFSDKNRDNAFTFWDLSAPNDDPTCWHHTLVCNSLVHRDDIEVVGGVFDYENTHLYAVDFDPNRNAFVLWAGVENVWSLQLPADLENGRWILTKIDNANGTAPGIATSTNPHNGAAYAYTGILGSWKYVPELDVFVGSQDGRGQIWAFKPAQWQFAQDIDGGGSDGGGSDGGGNTDGPLFEDDFDNGALNGWMSVSVGTIEGPSNWTVRNGEACQTSNVYSSPTDRNSLAKHGGYLQYNGGEFSDANISLTLNSGDDDAIGVMFRVQDSQNYYRFSWDKQRNYRRLVKSVNGVFTLLAEDSVGYDRHRDYQLDISADGPELDISINGRLVMSAFDTDISSGEMALYTWGNLAACFDNIVVTGLASDGNSAPVIESVTASPAQISDQETSQLSVSVSDVDGDNLTYLWEVSAGNGSIDNPTSATPTFTPTETFAERSVAISVSVSDGLKVRNGEVTVTVSPSGASTIFYENFDDGDFDGWTVVDDGTNQGPSNWQVIGGVLQQTTNIYSGATGRAGLAKLGTYIGFDGGYSFADFYASISLRSTDNDALGVMFRVQDSDNYYRLSWDEERNYRRLVKKVNGEFSLLAEDSVSFSRNQDYEIEIFAEGDSLQIMIDGESIFSVVDSDLNSGTIGLYSWGNTGSYFDEVLVVPQQQPQ